MSKKIVFDEAKWRELDALLQFRVTIAYCADYLGISRDTLIRRVRETHNLTFLEYHKLRMERTATKLQQKAIELALKGNSTMMIFCLKNLAGWSDKHEQEVNITNFEFVGDDD